MHIYYYHNFPFSLFRRPSSPSVLFEVNGPNKKQKDKRLFKLESWSLWTKCKIGFTSCALTVMPGHCNSAVKVFCLYAFKKLTN